MLSNGFARDDVQHCVGSAIPRKLLCASQSPTLEARAQRCIGENGDDRTREIAAFGNEQACLCVDDRFAQSRHVKCNDRRTACVSLDRRHAPAFDLRCADADPGAL